MVLSARGANERLNVAVIGCGRPRGHEPRRAVASESVVALCDVNRAAIGAAAAASPGRHYADFRRLFDERERRSSTPSW